MKKIIITLVTLLLTQSVFADVQPRRPGDNHGQNPGRGGPAPFPTPLPSPMPYPAPNPFPYPGDSRGDGRIGERFYNIQRDFREVEIIGFESRGTILLRFIDTGSVGGGWTSNDLARQNGCGNQFCVGEMAFNVTRDSRLTRVVGIQPNGSLVLKFVDTNLVGGNWNAQDLAKTSGCGRQFCVGERAFNVTRDSRKVEIVGIQQDGRYVVRFLDTNLTGGNWSDSDLAKEIGCGRSLCVGDIAVNVQRSNRQVQIVGIQFDGRYVIRFLDTNLTGGNWSDEDLYRIR